MKQTEGLKNLYKKNKKLSKMKFKLFKNKKKSEKISETSIPINLLLKSKNKNLSYKKIFIKKIIKQTKCKKLSMNCKENRQTKNKKRKKTPKLIILYFKNSKTNSETKKKKLNHKFKVKEKNIQNTFQPIILK